MNVSRAIALGLALLLAGTGSFNASAQEPASPRPAEAVDEMEIADSVEAAPSDAVDVADVEAPSQQADAALPPAPNPAVADPSLLPVFKQFGEVPGLTALMDDLMVILLADARMRPFFENADQVAIKKHLVEQFCVILGGPCTYTGRDMRASHSGLAITRGNFNALVEDLQIAMDKRKIPFRAQNKLLAKLAPMHREVQTR